MRLLFKNFCPNCNGNISNQRLELGTLCSKCLAKPYTSRYLIWKSLKEENKVQNYKNILKLSYQLSRIRKLFQKAIGNFPTSLQEVWIKRVIARRSFSIIAPTGIGKTTFALITSIYLATKGKKIYIMFPTSLLVQQAEEKMKNFIEKCEVDLNVIAYHSGLTKKQKDLAKEKIKTNDFDVLITTDRFIVSNFELLEGKRFDLIFVDDVDSFLKSAKNVDKIIKLLGGDDKLLEIALKKINKEEISEEEQNYFDRITKSMGSIIFSSATAKQRRTKKIRIFREVFKFDIGFKPEFLRNIDDFYMHAIGKEKLLELIKKLGNGGLIFVPMVNAKEKLDDLKRFLEKEGINCLVYEKPKKEIIDKFKAGEIQVLLGVASSRSPLSRGLDLPQTIRYAIFYGVPRFEVSLSTDTFVPSKLLALANVLVDIVGENERLELTKVINNLKKVLTLKKEDIEKIENGNLDNDFLVFANKVIRNAQEILHKYVSNEEVIKKIRESKELRLKEENGMFKILVADAVAYLQASGRTSRLYLGGVSKGLAILMVDDEKAFYGLNKKISYYIDDFEFKEFDWQEIEKTIEVVDRDRELIRKAIEGKMKRGEMEELIKVSLIIVESPTKARTIARLFGRAAKREVGNLVVNEIPVGNRIINVVASVGHVLDLVENEGFDGVLVNKENSHYEFLPIYDTIKRCKKCGEQFVGYNFCPKCGSKEILDKREIIENLRNLALEANEVIIATDADAEGEKIGYDLYVLLKPYNRNIKRMEFHEVTRKAIKEALENLRDINKNLVNAQILRRIEDRWIGFELSKILMRKFKQTNLSAGRVQTPVLGWIIERTKEARKKINVAIVKPKNLELSFYFENVDSNVASEKVIEISVEEKEETINPTPPFTTDALLKEASKLFRFSTDKTMKIAQQLFEMGLITYHRTDSTQVSSFGINLAKKYLEDKGLQEIFYARSYKGEGAHECIRPTRPIDTEQLRKLVAMKIFTFPIKLTKEHYMLYDLIFRRFIMSQCKPAKVIKKKIIAKLANYVSEKETIAKILEEGFLKFSKIKPQEIKPGNYEIEQIKIVKVWKAKPYTQGDVVSLMKEKGIGRPSTYAKIVTTIIQRKYVKEVKSLLFATRRGEMVYDFLIKNFYEMVNEETTRKLEEDMDKIENGQTNVEELILKVYKDVQQKILRKESLR